MVLELQAVRNGLKWRLRKSTNGRCRVLHLIDNQVVCSIIAKGRSSSLRLKRGLKKLNSLCWLAVQEGCQSGLRQAPSLNPRRRMHHKQHLLPCTRCCQSRLPHGFSTKYGAGIDTSYGIRSGGAQLSLLQWTQDFNYIIPGYVVVL